MRIQETSAQDPIQTCGSPPPAGPVELSLDLLRLWDEILTASDPVSPTTPVAEMGRSEAEEATGFPLGTGLAGLTGILLVVLVLGRARVRGAWRRREAGTPLPTPGEPAPEGPDESRPFPIRTRHTRRRGEEKPDQPIVVPLGGRRPPATPVTVRLPAGTASLLSGSRTDRGPPPPPPAEPHSDAGDAAESKGDESPAARTADPRTGRSWWIRD